MLIGRWLEMNAIKSYYLCIFGILMFTVFDVHGIEGTSNFRNDTAPIIRRSLIPDGDAIADLSQDPRVTEPVFITSNGFKNIVTAGYFKSQTSPHSNIESSCHAFMYEFSGAAANFTKCAVHYARPIKMCEQCYSVYQQAITIYDFMMKGNVTDGDGVMCGETILNADRVQIVVTTAMFITTMWSNSSCDNCYMRENNTAVHKLNNLTVNFKALVDRTFDCFHNKSWEHLTPYRPPKEVNGTVCKDCRAIYQELNNLYRDLEKEFPKHVCMDLVDSMNRTRLIWSRDFRCSRLHGNVAGVMVLSVFFCSLPFAFYIGSRVRGTAVQRKLLKQKRLKNVASLADMTVPVHDIPTIDLLNDESAIS